MEVTATVLEKAIIYASLKHQGQFRKGDQRPYILHPISVLITLGKFKQSKNRFLLAVACVLHDVVEDCGIPIEEIAKEFGYHVASIVQELTSDKEEIAKKGKDVYLLEKMIKMSKYALCIKLVDRLDNVSDMASLIEEKRIKTIKETRFILDGLIAKRVLTRTHKKIIKAIEKVLNKELKRLAVTI